MDAYFKKLGDAVLREWKLANFSLEKFPAIATSLLQQRPPAQHVKLRPFMREFLTREEQPLQSQSGFGQPEIIAYDHPRFYIQLLFWMEGTTDIHQHEFSGAFHVMHGSSLHALYEFDHAQAITPHLSVGDVRMKSVELLETGRTVPIISGKKCVHSLFHLDTPSVTVVVRTQHDPGTGPQFNYLPPHVAMDPMHSDTLTMRRKQLLDVLEATNDAEYPKLVREMIDDLDFERGFFILQHSMMHLRATETWDDILAAFVKKHGKPARGIGATLEEGLRRSIIKDLRAAVLDPEHRFFLALLMNVNSRTELFRLVAKRFPQDKPTDTLLRWCAQLLTEHDEGPAILDALLPASFVEATDDPFDLFLSALEHFLTAAKKPQGLLRALTAKQLAELHAVFANSSLRYLIGVNGK